MFVNKCNSYQNMRTFLQYIFFFSYSWRLGYNFSYLPHWIHYIVYLFFFKKMPIVYSRGMVVFVLFCLVNYDNFSGFFTTLNVRSHEIYMFGFVSNNANAQMRLRHPSAQSIQGMWPFPSPVSRRSQIFRPKVQNMNVTLLNHLIIRQSYTWVNVICLGTCLLKT